VVGVADVVPRRLLTDDEALHVDRGHEVGGAEDDRLHPRRRPGDRIDLDEALRVFDLRLDPDATLVEANRLFDLRKQQVEPLDLSGVLHLRQHDAVEVLAGTFDDLDDVAVGPLRREVVDAYDAGLAGPAPRVEGRDDVLARLLLRERGDGVLEVEKHLVGGQALGLVQHLRRAAGYGEARPPSTLHSVHARDVR
jgi:hypothetical protein